MNGAMTIMGLMEVMRRIQLAREPSPIGLVVAATGLATHLTAVQRIGATRTREAASTP